MFAQKPVVPRHEDGVPRYVFVGHRDVPRFCESSTRESRDSMYREAEQKIERLLSDPTGARMVCCLSGSGNGRVTLAELRKLIDSRQCDVIVVDDLSCLGRRQFRLWAFLDQAVNSGVRVISLAEELDSEAASWRLALSLTALLTGICRPRNRNS
jgi:hypothetical protein